MARLGGPDFLSVPERHPKPRSAGFTHVLHKGLSLVGLESLVETAGDYIDFSKLGWGTAYVSSGVKAKVAACRDADINICLGGTLLEIVVYQNRLDDYVAWFHRLGLDHVEVSNGALGMTADQKQENRRAAFPRVSSHLGGWFKEPGRADRTEKWVAEMLGDLEAGSSLVIAEGRESGTVGLFGPGGEVHGDLVESLIDCIPPRQIIFEAPRKDQQAWFIRRIGADANLGNIAPEEVLSLETLRRGLRADTVGLLPEQSHSPAQQAEPAAHWPPAMH